MLNDVNEYLEREQMSLNDWEMLLTAGWDRVGQNFFHRRYDCYRIMADWMGVMEIMPLRYRLSSDFIFSKSQKDILKRNEDLIKIFRPLELNEEKMNLFDAWYEKRFNKFGNIFTWVTTLERPFTMYEISLYKNNKLIACSFFDVTPNYQYSTLGMYHPDEAKRSLGTYTLMCELIQGINSGKTHHYPGHSYHGKSMYDYKKQFFNMEHYDWETKTWCDLPRGSTVNYIL